MKATEKQIRFVLFLLEQKGYGTRYMNSSFKSLGATMRERSGSVADWLSGKNVAEMSSLIDQLKGQK
jgi:hypothetical protein